jgi:DNA-binding NarL/FixJ family response regulator
MDFSHTRKHVHSESGSEHNFLIADIFPLFTQGLATLLNARETVLITAQKLECGVFIQSVEGFAPDAIFIGYEDSSDARLINIIDSLYKTRSVPVFAILNSEKDEALTMLLNEDVLILSRCYPLKKILKQVKKVLSQKKQENLKQSCGSKKVIFTEREKIVLRAYLSGLSITEIASRLNRSVKTISNQKMSARCRVNARSDAELYNFLSSPDGKEYLR